MSQYTHIARPPAERAPRGGLQEKILLLLAQRGPLNKSEIKKALRKDYSPTWNSLAVLVKRGLVEERGTGDTRGGRVPLWWLSWAGAVQAMTLGAEPARVRELASRFVTDPREAEPFLLAANVRTVYAGAKFKGDWAGAEEFEVLPRDGLFWRLYWAAELGADYPRASSPRMFAKALAASPALKARVLSGLKAYVSALEQMESA